MRFCVVLFLLSLAGCSVARDLVPADATSAFPEGRTFLVVNARTLAGDPTTLAVRDGSIVALADLPRDAPRFDAAGATIVPAFIDAHVHFAYDPVAAAHFAGGIAAAIDLASPIEALRAPNTDPLTVLRAGPMITAVGGYPLNSWGRAGYGIECNDAATCAARVDELVVAGAALIKVPIEDAGGLDDASLIAIAQRTHAAHRLLVAHALSARAIARAIRAGVDVLAHTPVVAIDDATSEALRGRVVISTLGAFGGAQTTVANLARLRAHGVDVVYGTDLGNTRTTGIDGHEVALLAAAGLDIDAIVAAATSSPARVFGLSRYGSLEPGHAASFLLYRADLRADPTQLARPDRVVMNGATVGP